MAYAVLGLASLFFIGHVLKWFFDKTKIPDVLILVIIGYIVGPVLGWVDPSEYTAVGTLLSTLALIVILYEGGLELHFKELVKTAMPALKISILAYILIVVVAFLAALIIAFQTWQVSLLYAMALGCVSAAVVIPVVKKLSISDETKTILKLEAAFADVLTIVLFLIAIDIIATKEFDPLKILFQIGPKTIAAIAIGVGSGLLWAFIQKRFYALSQMTFAGEAWALLTYGLMEIPHINGVLGVFALGFTLSNLDLLPVWARNNFVSRPVSKIEFALLSEITFLLKTFFFIYLGTLTQFVSPSAVLFTFLIIVLILLTRYVCVRFLFSKERTSQVDAMTITLMGPRGLATAVLATIPVQKGLEGADWIQSSVFSLVPLSIFVTAVLIFLVESPKFRPLFSKMFSGFSEDSIGSLQTTKSDIPGNSDKPDVTKNLVE